MSLKERLKLSPEPLYLMDGTAFIYRGFFANANMTRSDGMPTGAVFITARVLMKLLREEKPKYFGFIMDGKGPNFRHQIYPDYKSNRPPMPEGLQEQTEAVKQLVKALGLHLEISDNCEADDCIAGLVKRFHAERPVVIIGMDKDLRQCLAPNVLMWDPASKDEKILTLDTFRLETGLEPAQWPDAQALIGDSSDNIPGIKGVGPKTALALFHDFANLEDLRDRYDQVPEKVRKKIDGNLDALFLYRRLTRLDTGQCAEVSLKDLSLQPIRGEDALTVLGQYEMVSLKRELKLMISEGDLNAVDQAAVKAQPSVQMSLLDSQPAAISLPPSYKSLTEFSLPDLTGTIVALAPLPLVFGQHQRDRIHGLAVAVRDQGKTIAEFYWLGEIQELIEQLGKAKTLLCSDLKHLYHLHDAWKQIPIANWYDLSLAAYLLAPEERDYGWPYLSSRQTAKTGLQPGLAGSLALSLYDDQQPQLEALGLMPLFKRLEMPLTRVLADMEEAGILIDQSALADFLNDVQKNLDSLTAQIYEAAGGPFNLRSAQQVGEVLYKRMGLKASGNTRGGQASTSQQALEGLADEHPIINLLLEFRKLEKMRSTYLEPLPKLAGPDGRIHTTFNQMATATGRLSSSNPNLQNIPVRGEMGGRMRACFVAAPGYELISSDYSQVELRILAHFSQDPNLIKAFKEGEDIHSHTASLLFDLPPDKVDPAHRRMAKTINFGLIYGMGPRKMALDLGISQSEAKAFIDRYFKTFSHIKEYFQQVEAKAKQDAYVVTICGRRRPLPDIASPHAVNRALAERQAVNTVIQGSAADIIKLAMLKVADDQELQALQARMLLQVHDELVLEAPAANAVRVGQRLSAIMDNPDPDWLRLSVPIAVDWGHGVNWGQAH